MLKEQSVTQSLKHNWFSNIPKLPWLRTQRIMPQWTLHFTKKKWFLETHRKNRLHNRNYPPMAETALYSLTSCAKRTKTQAFLRQNQKAEISLQYITHDLYKFKKKTGKELAFFVQQTKSKLTIVLKRQRLKIEIDVKIPVTQFLK